jgi:hypothetical protein
MFGTSISMFATNVSISGGKNINLLLDFNPSNYSSSSSSYSSSSSPTESRHPIKAPDPSAAL